jgi:hypothetical protein
MTELEALIIKASQGEQNRYGDIEYTYSESERCTFITQITYLLNHAAPDNNEQEQITSLIYWSMHGTQNLVEHVFKNFLPWISEPYINRGFFRFLEENNTAESKLRWGEKLLKLSQYYPKSEALLSFRDSLFHGLKRIDASELEPSELAKQKHLIGLLLR